MATEAGTCLLAAICVSAFALSVVLVAAALRIAKHRAWYDPTDDRKIHQGFIPRLGGIGFSIAFMVISMIAVILFPPIYVNSALRDGIGPIFVSLVLIVVAGIVDDFWDLRPRYKLFVQIIAAAIILSSGLSFRFLELPFVRFTLDLGWLRYPITLLWIIGVTNAVNLMDGIDGLAGGVSLIISVTLTVLFAVSGNTGAVVFSSILAASIVGFLLFNLPLPKAKIFMGDCGSQFLGFLIAILPLVGKSSDNAALYLPAAAALLSIPIFDTFAAIWRRLRDGRNIGSPDRQHMHHKLLDFGFTVWRIDIMIWSQQAVIGFFVIVSFQSDAIASLVSLLMAYLIATVFFSILHYNNRRYFRSSAHNLRAYSATDTAPATSINPAV